MSQFSQRIFTLVRLEPLPATEVPKYIQHRLRAAGFRGEFMFSSDACQLIADRSAGIARLINNICYNALSLGCALRRTTLDADVIQQVLADSDLSAIASGGAIAEPETRPKRRKKTTAKTKLVAMEPEEEESEDEPTASLFAPQLTKASPVSDVPIAQGPTTPVSPIAPAPEVSAPTPARLELTNKAPQPEAASEMSQLDNNRSSAEVPVDRHPSVSVPPGVTNPRMSESQRPMKMQGSKGSNGHAPVVEVDSLARDYFLLDATNYRGPSPTDKKTSVTAVKNLPETTAKLSAAATGKTPPVIRKSVNANGTPAKAIPARTRTPGIGRFLSYVAILLLILALLLAWGITRVLTSQALSHSQVHFSRRAVRETLAHNRRV
jgi:hypothetical protein